MGLLDSNKIELQVKKGTIDVSTFTTAKNTSSVTNSGAYKTIVFDVSVSPYNDGEEWDCIFYLRTPYGSKIFGADGELYNGVRKNGRYYAYVMCSDVTFRFDGGNSEISKTATIDYTFCNHEVPSEPKPIEKLSSTHTTLSSYTPGSRLLVMDYVNVTGFKFFFATVYITNSSNQNTQRVFKVETVFSQMYKDVVSKKSTDVYVVESYEAYLAHTEWQQIYGDEIQLYMKLTDGAEGDNIYVNLYGVR